MTERIACLVASLTAALFILGCNNDIFSNIRSGNIGEVSKNLIDGVNIEERDEDGRTPLILAVMCKQDQVTQLLIEKGAAPNVVDKHLGGPLHYATRNKAEKIANLLIKHGADVSLCSNDGLSPLHVAARFGNVEMAELLIQNGADIDETCKKKVGTPLHIASMCGKPNMVVLLIKNGADILAVREDGRSPLHLCSVAPTSLDNSVLVAQILVDNGANWNSVDATGKTPLDLAKARRNAPLVEYLNMLTVDSKER